MATEITMNDLLQATIDEGASDLHVRAFMPPKLRIHGELVAIADEAFDEDDTFKLCHEIMTAEQSAEVEKNGGADFALAHEDGTRFRVSVFKERKRHLNDVMETKAFKEVFGEELARKIKISSTKSMTGHLLGATGALEAAVCAMAIDDRFIPPTINYENPDPECDLDYTPNTGVAKDIRVAVSTSLGFGGHNGVLVFKAAN